jgi:NADPH2:quinone reductase
MKALVQQSHQGPRDLALTIGQPLPVPGPGEYLIRVSAAGATSDGSLSAPH